jgi:PKD repeat protein
MRSIQFLIAVITGLFLLASCEAVQYLTNPDYNEPEAEISVITEGLPGLSGRYKPNSELNFDGSSSTGGDEAIETYTWDFGDDSTGEGSTASHIYTASGVYTVKLTVSDINALSGEDQVNIVINEMPLADISADSLTLTQGDSITLDGSGSSDNDGTIASYSWDLGDGTIDEGDQVTHTYGEEGEYTAALTVTDDWGTTNTVSTTITVEPSVNQEPVAEAGDDLTLDYNSYGSTVSLDGSDSSDTDGTLVSWEWTFSTLPEESTLNNSSISDLGSGQASFDISEESDAALTSGSLTYGLTLTVWDNDGASASDTIGISISGTGTVIIGIQ